jgi:uncharacterized membrane protein
MDTQKEQQKDKASNSNFLNKGLKSYVEFEEKWIDALAKLLTQFFGTLWFLNLILILTFFWILINLQVFPGISPFDPYPFDWFMMFIQVFAIVLSVIVLINQNRESKIDEVYQKMDFEINVRSEHEITKILQMIEEIHKKLGIAKKDVELEQMKENIDITEVKEVVEQAIEETDKISGIT